MRICSSARNDLSFYFDDKNLKTTHASIVLDSINEETGARITTWTIKLWKVLVAEFNTHRVCSRNSASSRAVKLSKMRERILSDPYLPFWWGKNKSGMQADEQLSPKDIESCKLVILEHMEHAIKTHEKLENIGLHKQITNRYLEPWMETEILFTATETKNMRDLRVHLDAQPEFMLPAEEAFFLMDASRPQVLKCGEWHIPFIREEEKDLPVLTKLRISAARCARVSYFLQDGKPSTWEKDLELCIRLMGSSPLHSSPFEHQAQAVGLSQIRYDDAFNSRAAKKLMGNFCSSFYQHRGYVELGIGKYGDWEAKDD